jgi:hypothetical protein
MAIDDVNGHKTQITDSASYPSTMEEMENKPGADLFTSREDDAAGLGTRRENIRFATRADGVTTTSLDKRKLMILGGAVLAAIAFFVLTTVVGKSHSSRKTHSTNAAQSPATQPSRGPKESVTPVMETVNKPTVQTNDGQLTPADIKRTRSVDSGQTEKAFQPTKSTGNDKPPLSSVPPFSETQQKWEEPRPHSATSETPEPAIRQQQSELQESSMIFVRSQTQNQQPLAAKTITTSDDIELLNIEPGTRVEAKLKTQISSAVADRVIAELEYTYAIGDRIIFPAGTRFIGTLRQANRFGDVDVKFDEVELSEHQRVKVEAIGLGLDLGPIKGTVIGKNTGKNFLIRAGSGIGSVAAMLVGNNTSASFSEDDLLRERIAQNIGNAGDAELMNLNANSRIVVSVPAETRIYIVFTQFQKGAPTLRQISAPTAQ